MTLVELSLFQRNFSLISSKCNFKNFTSLNGFYDLESMINIVCIYAEYQTGAIEDLCFETVP